MNWWLLAARGEIVEERKKGKLEREEDFNEVAEVCSSRKVGYMVGKSTWEVLGKVQVLLSCLAPSTKPFSGMHGHNSRTT